MGNKIIIHNQFRLVFGLLNCVLFTSEKAQPETKIPISNKINNILIITQNKNTNLVCFMLIFHVTLLFFLRTRYVGTPFAN